MLHGPRCVRSIAPVSVMAVCVIAAWLLGSAGDSKRLGAAEPDFPNRLQAVMARYCFDCHQSAEPAAGLNLEQMLQAPADQHYKQWQKVLDWVGQQQMPPVESEQPNAVQRRQLLGWVQAELNHVAASHADDPGPVTLRRLTGAEYSYTIEDLTGLQLNLDRQFVSDAVGGEGFTNVGNVQFMQDSTLERYLGAAKQVAEHAVIGAGPLHFYEVGAETGFELSAMARIQAIYRQHGFRTAAGEGGIEFGLDHYARALFVAWQFRNRDGLELPAATLISLAKHEAVSPRFAQHIWRVLTDKPREMPTSEIVKAWQAIPSPAANLPQAVSRARDECARIQTLVLEWQDRFGQNPDAKEEARVLAADSFQVARSQLLEMNINWPVGTTLEVAHLTFGVEPANGKETSSPTVIWRDAAVQYRIPDQLLEDPQPLARFLAPGDAARLQFGKHPADHPIPAGDFASQGTKPFTIRLPIPPGATSARLLVTAELDVSGRSNEIVRCTIAQREDTDQGKSISALLANPQHPEFAAWKSGVLEFAGLLPQISHREPAPSDRDPIPAPLDNSYNNPERNLFHSQIKYHRDDQFLVENMLDDDARRQLDQAWADLLSSFDYHQGLFRMLAVKYEIDLEDRTVGTVSKRWLAGLAPEPRQHIQRLSDEYHRVRAAQSASQPGHLQDLLAFANLAWRRPLNVEERDSLTGFYQTLMTSGELNHRQAVRAALVRILMSPSFLYRVESSELDLKPADSPNGVTALDDWQVANRLSFFLWSSVPDQELRRAAAAGQLRTAEQVAQQAKRMLADPKAERLAREFFGQWLGFYRFDRYQGVDPGRFPEFTESLRSSMYLESVKFFEHIIRQDRPVREMLFADYVFANRELAAHYGLPQEVDSTEQLERVGRVASAHRGGLLGLASVLTVTSAPLRTSAVKRGDWILRRILGTPVPPPPADAGSIAADDVLGDKLTVRQRLEAHRQNVSCRNCHARLDPLGFTLEKYDTLGRWREAYRDGQPIDVTGTLHSGEAISGPDGLRNYLAENMALFHRTLCVKLLGFALGRGESIADAALLNQMAAELKTGDGRFSSLVETIVRSRQFRFQRTNRDQGSTGDD